jgi:hypothetical protein
LQLIQQQKLKVPMMHAIVVGSDMSAQTKFETQLRQIVVKSGIHARVHFVNKTLAVAPYLAAIDVLVQNSQVSHNVIHEPWFFPSKFCATVHSFMFYICSIQWLMNDLT